jgi:large subunit ribosomal protein L24
MIPQHYTDGRIFFTPEGEAPVSKRAVEVPLPLENVRLVVPYRMTTQTQDGRAVHSWSDVVVDKIVMERHTTGRDPFTNINYGTQAFPEEHRFDPATGLPIFNRYIAGTRRRIQWPWETIIPETGQVGGLPENSKDNTSLIGKIKSPVKFLKSKLAKRKEDKPSTAPKTPEQVEADRLEIKLNQVNKVPKRPRGPPENFTPDSEADTGRNKAEPSPHTSSFYPTLVYPPFPSQLTSEIQDHAQETDTKERNEKQDWYEDGKEVTTEERAERKAAKAEKLRRKVVPDSMKTPLQLRWELERRNKLAEAEKTKVDREVLLIALGQHMEATRAAKKGVRRPAMKQEPVAELD